MKFNYIAHDNLSKSTKKYWPVKLSSFNWKRKMNETRRKLTAPVTFINIIEYSKIEILA